MQQFVGEKEVDASYTLEELTVFDKPKRKKPVKHPVIPGESKADRKKRLDRQYYLTERRSTPEKQRLERTRSLDWYHANRERSLSATQAARFRRHRTIEGRVKSLYSQARTRARQRGIPFTITLEYLMSIVTPNCGLCPSMPLAWDQVGQGHNPLFKAFSPSLDQIHAGCGYVPGNVHFVSWFANSTKSHYGSEFADYGIELWATIKKKIPVKF